MPRIGVFRAYIALFGTEKVDLRRSFHHEGHEEHEGGLQDETLDAILELRDVEIDQQSDFDAGKLHVGQQLRLVDALDLLDTLQLKDQRVFHKNIDAVATVQAGALVFDWLRVLKQEGDPVVGIMGDVSNFSTIRLNNGGTGEKAGRL
jgi:hypothetical protein